MVSGPAACGHCGKEDELKSYRVIESLLIQAPAATVYSTIADYEEGHPKILPPKYFSNLVIEEGGKGAGTRLRFRMHAPGTSQDFHVAITELVPGRTITETELDSGIVTTFTVLPLSDGEGCRVTISTELTARDGFLGTIERTMTGMFLRRVYAQELRLLEDVVRREKSAAGSAKV